MVKSDRVYGVEEYLAMVTGDYSGPLIKKNQVEAAEKILEEKGLCLWSYALDEIDHVLENDVDVVLVECHIQNELTGLYESVHRWFEIEECDLHRKTTSKKRIAAYIYKWSFIWISWAVVNKPLDPIPYASNVTTVTMTPQSQLKKVFFSFTKKGAIKKLEKWIVKEM